MTSATEVVEAHWLMILGVLIVFVTLASAVRFVRQPRWAVASTWTAFVGAACLVAGFAWDSVRHIQGTESPTAHAMIYAGAILVIAALPAALALTRR